jgi:CRISPR-associated protein Cas1
MKRNLYITTHSQIKRDGNTLRVTTEGDTLTVPISVIGNLYLFGRSTLSSGARNFLLVNNADIFFLSKSGRLNGILSNTKLRSNYRNRLLQYKAFDTDQVKIAKIFVTKKIETIASYCGRSMQRYLIHADSAETIDRLRGIEGAATLYLFEKVREELAEIGIQFTGRSYRPPADEVNSLLSFVYTLHYAYIYSLLLGYGLDPYIGFLHLKRGAHAPLVSDVMESQRIDLTRFVVSLFVDGSITPDDFTEGYRLGNERMRDVIRLYSDLFVYDRSANTALESFIESVTGAF